MPESRKPEGMVECPRGDKTREPKLERDEEREFLFWVSNI